MTAMVKKKVKILAKVQCNVSETVWEAAKARQAATREIVTGCLDRVDGKVTNVVPTTTANSFSAPGKKGDDDPITTMKWRGLLLADAIQRHALMKIAETGVMLEEIDQAVANALTRNDLLE